MIPRALPAVLALLLAGDGVAERDPFVAALEGKAGPEAVAAPDFDPEREALSWSMRPRREIVDGLAARLLRGEAKGWTEPAMEAPALPASPSRIPADFDPSGVPVTDRLAAWVPGDAAAVFFESLASAETQVGEIAQFLPRAFPALCGDPPGGRRDALARAVEMLLLPPIWRANPGVRTGTRQVAIVASDPDLRWAPDVALLCEVDDATLVRTHRSATFSWEDRSPRRLKVEALDAWTEDGAVRSFFALEGSVAIWSTTRSLRDRILASGAGKAPSLLKPDARAYALARRTFPPDGVGALLVVPDAFLVRVNSLEVRAKRAAALRCEAARLLLAARAIAGGEGPGPSCPLGGTTGPGCSLHGTVARPVPMGDVPGVGIRVADLVPSPASAVLSCPVAARWRGSPLHVLVPAGDPGAGFLRLWKEKEGAWRLGRRWIRWTPRLEDRVPPDQWAEVVRSLTGLERTDAEDRSVSAHVPAARERGGLLDVALEGDIGVNGWLLGSVRLEWR